MTIQEQIDVLKNKYRELETDIDNQLMEIQEEIDELEAVMCQKCQGCGDILTGRDDFMNVCPDCNGTGMDA